MIFDFDDNDDGDNTDDENRREKSSHLKQLRMDLELSGQSKGSPLAEKLQNELEKLHLERYWKNTLTSSSVGGKSSRLKKEAADLTNGEHGNGKEAVPAMNGRIRGFGSELEKVEQVMPKSSGGGNKRCARCYKRWSLDSGGWGKRGSEGKSWGKPVKSWGKPVKSGDESSWYNILRARVGAELRAEKQMEDSMHAVLLWGRARGLILGKRMTDKAREKPISRIDSREAAGTRRRRALPPLDESRASGQIGMSEPGKNVRDDLVFVVPLTNTGWNLDYWGRLRRKHLFSERIQRISVSRPTLAIGNYW